MTAAAARVLVDEIMPRIRSAVPRILKRGGSEDDSELIQDGVVQAVDAIESCEARGQPLFASSIAFYTLQRLKSGRRANYAGRADAMSVSAQLDGHSTLSSMDEPLPCDDEEGGTLHDLLAYNEEDPSEAAARRIDWSELMDGLSDRDLAILRTTVNGDSFSRLAEQFGVSAPRVTQLKAELGRQIKQRWGDGILGEVAHVPTWHACLNAIREQALCRHERAVLAGG